jgi:ribosomal RNA assembly protein
MAPKKALKLLEDENFFTLVDLKDFVSKRTNQQRRVRGRIIGSKGKIRQLIESHTGCEITVYGSTVVIVGDEIGLPLAQDAVERIASGSEHGSVIKGLERERKRARLAGKTIDYIQAQDDFDDDGFEALVPGFADLSRRLNRRLKASQIDPEDEEEVAQALELGEDESISWEEE